jgi:hypothetical protein
MTLEVSSKSNLQSHYHHTDAQTITYPGVGEYDIAKSSLDTKNRSPQATFGDQLRFPKRNPL